MAPAMLNDPKAAPTTPSGPARSSSPSGSPTTTSPRRHFPGYWRKGYPYLEKMTYKPIPDSTARSQALAVRDHRHDDHRHAPGDRPVPGQPAVGLHRRQRRHRRRGGHELCAAEPGSAAVQQPDRPSGHGQGGQPGRLRPDHRHRGEARSRPACSSPGSPYFSKTTLPKYDPSGAKKLVKQVQQQTGKPVSFTLGATNSPSAIRGQTYLAQQYKQVGMKVSTTVIEQNEYIDNALSGKFQAYTWRQFGAVEPGPQLHLLEHHHLQRQRPVDQHGPEQRPAGGGRLAGGPDQHRRPDPHRPPTRR